MVPVIAAERKRRLFLGEFAEVAFDDAAVLGADVDLAGLEQLANLVGRQVAGFDAGRVDDLGLLIALVNLLLVLVALFLAALLFLVAGADLELLVLGLALVERLAALAALLAGHVEACEEVGIDIALANAARYFVEGVDELENVLDLSLDRIDLTVDLGARRSRACGAVAVPAAARLTETGALTRLL